ncbi:MAG: FkbM family methyltransferase [Rhodoferax sp.]|uniref:FkbM family methyltransferase n=1 Tax=Rhodoferax sp. TaxID=50421 RepID=UPI00271E495D|nr:FkbM family methyltransferase [Rhodoferax sp.]MDO8450886.1 FkbM family methyltransferase [Rhodoferax sp.]
MTLGVNKLSNRFTRIFGCQFIPDWRIERYHQTDYLRRLFDVKQIDLVFDVGANKGQYRDYLRAHIGFKGMILSFEPHPECLAEITRRSATDDNWKVFPYALGAQQGVLQFNLMRDSQFSSFHAPIQPERLDRGSDNVVERTVDVRIDTLDFVFDGLKRSFQFARPFLKLDTQGYDMEVLRGASTCIAKFPAIQAELSNIPIYSSIVGLGQSIAELNQLGFDLGAIFPANPDQFPVVTDFDAYFINQESIE